jgi:hypothetical protein
VGEQEPTPPRDALAERGFAVSQKLVGRLLRRLGFSLQANSAQVQRMKQLFRLRPKVAHAGRLAGGGWGRNDAAEIWEWINALCEIAPTIGATTGSISVEVGVAGSTASTTRGFEWFIGLRPGSYRPRETTADRRAAFKRHVLIDPALYPKPAEVIAERLKRPIEWLGHEGEPHIEECADEQPAQQAEQATEQGEEKARHEERQTTPDKQQFGGETKTNRIKSKTGRAAASNSGPALEPST